MHVFLFARSLIGARVDAGFNITVFTGRVTELPFAIILACRVNKSTEPVSVIESQVLIAFLRLTTRGCSEALSEGNSHDE